MTSMQAAREKAEKLPRMPQRKLDGIPGDLGMPLLGQTFEFLRDFHGLVNRMADEHGPVFKGSIMFQHGVTLIGPEAAEFVLRDREHVFSSRAAWNPLLEKLFTNGLMLRDFDNHKFHRRIMQQAFKKKALAGYMDRMNPHIAGGIKEWPVGEEFSFFEAIKALLLDVGAGIFLGLDMGPEARKVNESFVAAVDASLAVLRVNVPGTTWHRGMKGRRYLEDFMTRLIPEKRKGDGNDFFTELCQAADEETDATFTDEDVMNHMIFLLFAAHDTTTSTLSSIMFALAKNPEWQDKLAEEARSLGKDHLEYEDLDKLEKTGWVFREALRMHPPLPTIPRRTTEEVEWKGYRLPKNTLVNICPLHTHYMAEHWTNPYRFDPERFSPERAEDKGHFFQWIPFGGGHHKCIGLNFAELQSKTFLFHFLRDYRVKVREGYDMPYQQVPLAVPKDGLPITIEKR
jgi:cytochrome P450